MICTQRFAALALAASWLAVLPSMSVADEPSECEPINIRDAAKMKGLIEKYGGEEFRNPIAVRPTSEAAKHDIVVHYAANRIVGCNARLRSYNGKVVGETIYARPGDTLHLRLVNALPPVEGGLHKHPQDPPPAGHSHHFSFNATNLHTHGLHTAPRVRRSPVATRRSSKATTCWSYLDQANSRNTGSIFTTSIQPAPSGIMHTCMARQRSNLRAAWAVL